MVYVRYPLEWHRRPPPHTHTHTFARISPAHCCVQRCVRRVFTKVYRCEYFILSAVSEADVLSQSRADSEKLRQEIARLQLEKEAHIAKASEEAVHQVASARKQLEAELERSKGSRVTSL